MSSKAATPQPVRRPIPAWRFVQARCRHSWRNWVDALKNSPAATSHDHSDESEAFDELAAGQRLERFLDVLAHDIAEAGDKAVVVVGEHLGADAVAAGIRMNQKLGSLGKSQKFAAIDQGEIGETVSLWLR